MKNWKTTTAGVSVVFLALGHLLGQVSTGDFSSIGTDGPLIVSGLIGIFAKDNNVTGT